MYIKKSSSKRNGKKYETYQIVESYRNEAGNPRQRILLNLGPAHKFLKKDIDSLINGLLKAKGLKADDLTVPNTKFYSSKSFGQIWAFMHLWKQLKISQIIGRQKQKTNIRFDLESHLKTLVFNRLDNPSSKLKLLTWLETVYLPGLDNKSIRYEYLLRSMDFLIEHKEEIENQIADRFLGLFDTSLRLCFYDITSTYFEASSSLSDDDIRKKGYSRDHRPDREQIVIGVVMNQAGIPLAHYSFPGNTADRSTVQKIISDIKARFGIDHITLVADKGMVSGNNVKFILDNDDGCIFGESVRTTKLAREIIKAASRERKVNAPGSDAYIFETEEIRTIRYTQQTENGLKKRSVKRKMRFVASYNGKSAKKKALTRSSKINNTLKKCEEINQKNIDLEDKYAQVKNLIDRRKLSSMLCADMEGSRIAVTKKEEVINQEKESDGWFLTLTSNNHLSKEEIINRYKDLKYVEHAFKELKHSLDLRPNYHWTEDRIKAHVMICFLALQLSTLFEKRIKKLNLSWEKAVTELRKIHVIEWKTQNKWNKGLVKVNSEQIELFKLVGCKNPKINDL